MRGQHSTHIAALALVTGLVVPGTDHETASSARQLRLASTVAHSLFSHPVLINNINNNIITVIIVFCCQHLYQNIETKRVLGFKIQNRLHYVQDHQKDNRRKTFKKYFSNHFNCVSTRTNCSVQIFWPECLNFRDKDLCFKTKISNGKDSRPKLSPSELCLSIFKIWLDQQPTNSEA